MAEKHFQQGLSDSLRRECIITPSLQLPFPAALCLPFSGTLKYDSLLKMHILSGLTQEDRAAVQLPTGVSWSKGAAVGCFTIDFQGIQLPSAYTFPLALPGITNALLLLLLLMSR